MTGKKKGRRKKCEMAFFSSSKTSHGERSSGEGRQQI